MFKIFKNIDDIELCLFDVFAVLMWEKEAQFFSRNSNARSTPFIVEISKSPLGGNNNRIVAIQRR